MSESAQAPGPAEARVERERSVSLVGGGQAELVPVFTEGLVFDGGATVGAVVGGGSVQAPGHESVLLRDRLWWVAPRRGVGLAHPGRDVCSMGSQAGLVLRVA